MCHCGLCCDIVKLCSVEMLRLQLIKGSLYVLLDIKSPKCNSNCLARCKQQQLFVHCSQFEAKRLTNKVP